MILGIGTDLCAVSRMRRACANEHFVRKVFLPEEAEYARLKGNPAEHFAAAFAAKEALAKASGLGLFGIGLSCVMVRRTESGPAIICTGTLLEKLEALGMKKCWLSLTHEGGFALAFVVMES
ncbi:MAG: 4'-phosphopantetheinyl transferase superfamily protein [Synergistaceae bacterium]|jgi:holo-[acyl-carrier protein] synthase|nr:4'-phosphopantetheinyl transferase superfamily protein [Synergistaceae bacterium]